MELISYPLLVLEFIKHQGDLVSRGYHLEIRSSLNIFQDQFVISKVLNGRTFQFTIQHRLWDRYREFTINLGSPYATNISGGSSWGHNATTGYHYRLNPINMQVIQVQRSGSGTDQWGFNPWSAQPHDFSGELRDFADEILRMINHLIEKVQSDKINLDSSELI